MPPNQFHTEGNKPGIKYLNQACTMKKKRITKKMSVLTISLSDERPAS